MKEIVVTYRERRMLDKFRCIDEVRKVRFIKYFISGNLLYGYTGRFSVMSISIEDIISIRKE